jgi:hypothetical protein
MRASLPVEGVVDWRRRRLLAAGVPQRLAAWIAAQSHADLHELLELIDRGCRPDLAVRIVAPLEERPPC